MNEVRGAVVIVQEDRFRLVDERGRGYLFTLGRRAGISIGKLRQAASRGMPVRVRFTGAPDLGAVAVQVSLSSI